MPKPGGHDHDAVNVGDHEITGLDKQAANDRGCRHAVTAVLRLQSSGNPPRHHTG